MSTREKIIDWLPRFLFYSDKKAPKLILMKETNTYITTRQEIPNIFSVLIITKFFMNERHNKVAESSNDLVIFAIPILKTVRETRVFFILTTDWRCDVTNDIIP